MSDPTVETRARQTITGLALTAGGKTDCADCGATVREGDRVDATRPTEADRFEIDRVACRACRGDRIDHPTPGVRELRAFARLAVTTDDASRDAELTLRAPEIVADSRLVGDDEL